MTEKEKMLSGKIYDPTDITLVKWRKCVYWSQCIFTDAHSSHEVSG